MSGVNPQGCQVYSFRNPSAEELQHDFLWRTTRVLPERGSWDEYMQAYDEMLGATSTKDCPWYIVPADDKKNARLIISSIINEVLSELDMDYPKADAKQRRVLARARRLPITDTAKS